MSASLGKFLSTTPCADLDGLFQPQLTTDHVAGAPIYRCLFVANFNGTATLQDASVYIFDESATQSDIEIGLDPSGVVAVGLGTPQALEVPDEVTAPPGVFFSQPLTPEAALPLGNLTPETARAVWVRRVPTGGAAASAEAFTLRVTGTLTP